LEEVDMSESEKATIPSQELTQRVITRLMKKNLLSKEEALKIESKVAEGKMQSADWKLVFEKSLNFHKTSKKE
jgi:hypothetical protein